MDRDFDVYENFEYGVYRHSVDRTYSPEVAYDLLVSSYEETYEKIVDPLDKYIYDYYAPNEVEDEPM